METPVNLNAYLLFMVAEASFPSRVLPIACPHLRADAEFRRNGALQRRASAELCRWDASPLERDLLYLHPSFSLHFIVASSDISETGQSWQLLHCASREIFWGPINSQPLQLAGGRPGNKWVWRAARAVNPGCCSLVRPHLLCSHAVPLCGRFLYLT